MKTSRYLTHIRRLDGSREAGSGASTSASSRSPRSPKLGPVLWQLPPTFKRNDERLRLGARGASRRGATASSSASRRWYADEVYALLREHGAALVIPDSPKYPFRALELTADWTFVRFHHGTRGRSGNYSESELEEWAERIAGWREGGIDVYAYYNNDWEGYAVKNGLRLRELSASRLLGGMQPTPEQITEALGKVYRPRAEEARHRARDGARRRRPRLPHRR